MSTLLNLGKRLFNVKFWLLLVVSIAVIAGAWYFWKLNGTNLTWCSTHSLECQVSRIQNQKDVLEKAVTREGK